MFMNIFRAFATLLYLLLNLAPVVKTQLLACNVGYSGPVGGPCTACAAGKYKEENEYDIELLSSPCDTEMPRGKWVYEGLHNGLPLYKKVGVNMYLFGRTNGWFVFPNKNFGAGSY
jgi:hypothetical protein